MTEQNVDAVLKIVFFRVSEDRIVLRKSKALRLAQTQTFTAPALGFGNQGELKMPYVYADVRKLEKHAKVGDSECVALVRAYTRAPSTSLWRQGAAVMGERTLASGTAIATFVNARWPSNSHGNHAAFYLGKVSNGMYIMDQWNRTDKKEISSRFIYRLGKNKDGSYVRPSDNADAFSVIE